MDKELLFWVLALVLGLIGLVRALLTPQDLYASKETIDRIIKEGRDL